MIFLPDIVPILLLQSSCMVAISKKLKLKFTKAWLSFLRLLLPLDIYKEVYVKKGLSHFFSIDSVLFVNDLSANELCTLKHNPWPLVEVYFYHIKKKILRECCLSSIILLMYFLANIAHWIPFQSSLLLLGSC